ncbi:MAG: tetratricopeptide repeat protein [Leptospirales bacterium]|nr:tetratricopeptide repeat protein [Leptospirales bacterium]
MKKLIIIFLLINSMAYAKDYHRTEEIINSILSEENDESHKKIDPPIKKPEENRGKTGKDKPQNNQDDAKKNSAMSGKDEVLLKTGIQFYESGLLDHSLARFEDLIKNYPSSPFVNNARMWTGRIYLKKYKYDEAIKQFDDIKEQSGEYPASLYYKAEVYKYKSDSINAIDFYQKVYASYPEHELADKAIINTGKLYLNSGKGYQALESAIRIIRYYNDRDTIDDAYYLIAKVYEKDPMLKDMEISRKFYRIFIKKADQNQKHFTDSPLLETVKKDLQYIEKTYFKFEN